MTNKKAVEPMLRNKILLDKILRQWPTVAAFCREKNFSEHDVGRLLNLKKQPLHKQGGGYVPLCQRLAKEFSCSAETLFPMDLYDKRDPKYLIAPRPHNSVLAQIILGKWPSVNAFCLERGFHPTVVSELLNLKRSPLHRTTGKFIVPCKELAKEFGYLVEDLFPLPLYGIEMPEERVEITFTEIRRGKFGGARLAAPETPFDAIVKKQLRTKLLAALSSLTPQEARVLKDRFGWDGEKRTLEEISRDYGVDRERIRQIEEKALARLRHPVRAKMLKPFLKK